MEQDAYIYENIRPNMSLIEEAFKFNPATIEETDGVVISKYCISLGQYLVFLQSQINKTKAEAHRLRTFIERTVALGYNNELKKKFGTVGAAKDFLLESNPDLTTKNQELNKYKEELIKVDGMLEAISELIATFKRELTRRERDLYTIRAERR